MRRSSDCGGMAVALLVLAGCGSRPLNPPLGQQDLSYRDGECSYSFATGSAPPTGFSVALCQRLADTVKTELKRPAL